MIFEGKLEERRGRGRPRLRWINDVEDDLRKFGVEFWRTKALDREEWASIIREAKDKLKGRSAIARRISIHTICDWYVCMYVHIGFKTFFYVVLLLDSIASYLPTGLHLGFFRS